MRSTRIQYKRDKVRLNTTLGASVFMIVIHSGIGKYFIYMVALLRLRTVRSLGTLVLV